MSYVQTKLLTRKDIPWILAESEEMVNRKTLQDHFKQPNMSISMKDKRSDKPRAILLVLVTKTGFSFITFYKNKNTMTVKKEMIKVIRNVAKISTALFKTDTDSFNNHFVEFKGNNDSIYNQVRFKWVS